MLIPGSKITETFKKSVATALKRLEREHRDEMPMGVDSQRFREACHALIEHEVKRRSRELSKLVSRYNFQEFLLKKVVGRKEEAKALIKNKQTCMGAIRAAFGEIKRWLLHDKVKTSRCMVPHVVTAPLLRFIYNT